MAVSHSTHNLKINGLNPAVIGRELLAMGNKWQKVERMEKIIDPFNVISVIES